MCGAQEIAGILTRAMKFLLLLPGQQTNLYRRFQPHTGRYERTQVDAECCYSV